MKKSEKLVLFYNSCTSKGYTDMTDETQALKAKVIANDLGLPINNIDKLFISSKEAYEQEQKRLHEEEEQRQEKIKKLKVDGEKLFTIKRDLKVDGGPNVDVFRRPDGSIYCIEEGSEEKIERLRIDKTNSVFVNTKYHPSQTVYTGATVGGIHMGGFHTTEAYTTQTTTSTGNGTVFGTYGSKSIQIASVILTADTAEAFARDPYIIKYFSPGWTKIGCKAAGNKAMLDAAIATNQMSAWSSYFDSRCIPMSQCKEVVRFFNRILKNDCPPTDRERLAEAEELIKNDSVDDLEKALKILYTIEDYRERGGDEDAVRAHIRKLEVETRKRLDVRIQHEKEQEILKKEAERPKKIAKTIICIIASIAIIAAILFIVFYLVPNNNYKNAQVLFNNGEYTKSADAFFKLDGFKDSEVMVKESNYQYAVSLLEKEEYENAKKIFEELGDYKDSEKFISYMDLTVDRMKNSNPYIGPLYNELSELSGFLDVDEILDRECFKQFKTMIGTWNVVGESYHKYKLTIDENGEFTIKDGDKTHYSGYLTLTKDGETIYFYGKQFSFKPEYLFKTKSVDSEKLTMSFLDNSHTYTYVKIK